MMDLISVQVTLRCVSERLNTGVRSDPLDMIRHNCSIGNPFSGPGMVQLRVNLNIRSGVLGNEGNVLINFTVSSLNPDNRSTIIDNSNFAVQELSFEARANISIDNG